MSRRKLSRRQFVAATALSSAALITAPYIRGAHAAGKLTMGFWDHWVPEANKASTDLVNEWAAKEKVEVSIDYIPSQGNKNLLTIAAEGPAKSGHDIRAMPTWWPHANSELLEPVNDIMEPRTAAGFALPSPYCKGHRDANRDQSRGPLRIWRGPVGMG